MKKTLFLTLAIFFAFALSASAQNAEFYSTRLENAANRLKRATVDLVDATSRDLRRGGSNTRSDIDAAFLAHQLDASAGLFQQMVRDNLRAGDLRDAAAILNDLVRRAPGYGRYGNLWRDAQNSIGDINRELGGPGDGNGDGGNDNRPVTGRVYWRGMVDDRVQLVIRNRSVEVRTISGRSYPDGTYSFTSPLPNRNVTVGVNKTRGRGSVRVVQQPSRSNDFTTVIEIYDDEGGARDYQLDIFWR